MIQTNLFTPMEERRVDNSMIGSQMFISFINQIEGWKTRCKNLHWSAPKKNIHTYLDEFLDVLSDYQDGLAEEEMGIFGKMEPLAVSGVHCDATNAIAFINEVNTKTLGFYSSIPNTPDCAGIKSECETFIHNIKKYKYLFSLTDAVNF